MIEFTAVASFRNDFPISGFRSSCSLTLSILSIAASTIRAISETSSARDPDRVPRRGQFSQRLPDQRISFVVLTDVVDIIDRRVDNPRDIRNQFRARSSRQLSPTLGILFIFLRRFRIRRRRRRAIDDEQPALRRFDKDVYPLVEDLCLLDEIDFLRRQIIALRQSRVCKQQGDNKREQDSGSHGWLLFGVGVSLGFSLGLSGFGGSRKTV